MFRLQGQASELVRLMLTQLFLNACVAGMRMTMSLRMAQGDEAVGGLIALFALSQIFLALPAGRYCERHGLKGPILRSLAVAVCGCALAAAWPIFPVLCVSAVLTGGAGGVAIIAIQRHTPRVAGGPDTLHNAFSWLAIGLALSNVLGPLVAGVVIDAAGFRTAFVAMATLPLLAWLAVRGARDHLPIAPEAANRPTGIWSLWRDPALRRLLIVTWLLASCWDLHTFVVPLLGHERGLPAAMVGSILGAFGIGAAAVRLLTPLVVTHLREWAVLVGAMIATAILFGIYPLMYAPWAMGMCSALLGLTLGGVQPMAMSLLHRLAPEHRYGEAVAMRLMVINMSSVGIPIASGAVVTSIGTAGVFWAAGVMVAAGTKLTIGLRKH